MGEENTDMKMTAIRMAWVLAGCAALAGGCGKAGGEAGEGTAAGGVSAVDALGREVRLEKPARRLLVTGKASYAIEHALYLLPTVREECEVIGARGRGGGARATAEGFLEAMGAGTGRKGGVALSEGNVEEILARGPDVVLLKTSSRLFGASLEGAGATEAYLSLESAEDYDRDLATLGALAGAEDEAEAARAYYREVRERVERGLEGLEEAEKPRVLAVQYNASRGAGACRVPPPDWIQTWMVRTAGGVPAWTEGMPGGQWGAVSVEQVLAWDPDIVLAVCYGEPATTAVEALGADAAWRETRAWKEGRVKAFPGDFLSWDQPDTRWGLGLLWVAKTLHPERFADVDLEAEMERFYALYGLDAAWVREKARPLVAEEL